MIFFSVYTLFYVSKFRIRLGDSYIEKIAFGSTRLFYGQIKVLKFYENKIVIRNDSSKIYISRDIDKQEELIKQVISKVKDNPNLSVSGNKKLKKIYFPEKTSVNP